MKRWIYVLLLSLFVMLLVACSKKDRPSEIKVAKEAFVVERIFDGDISLDGIQIGCFVGTDYYTMREGLVRKYDLITGETSETPMMLGDREVLKQPCYVDANGMTRVVCRSMVEETGEYHDSFTTFDAVGNLVSEYDCTDIFKKVHYAQSMLWPIVRFLQDGKMLIFYVEEDKQYQMLVSEEAQIIYDEEKNMGVVNYKITDSGMLLIYTKENGLFEMDPQTGEWKQISDKFQDDEFVDFIDGAMLDEAYGIYYRTNNSIRKYDLNTNEIQVIVEYEDYSLNPQDVGYNGRTPNGDFIVLYCSGISSFNFYRLRKASEGEIIPEKKEIVLGFVGIEGMYDKEVYAYNSSQDNVHVKLKTYADADSLIVDIMTGNIPDMIDVGDALVYQAMEEKGLLDDLNVFLEKDDQLSRDDFLERSLHYYEKDGKLYAIPYGMQIYGLMVNRNFLEGRNSWNLKEFEAFMDSLPKQEMVTEACTRNEMLYYLCMQYLDHFVDQDNQYCNFQSEEFGELLRCAKRFAVLDEKQTDYEGRREKIVDDEVILTTLGINSINFEYAFTRALFRKNGQLIGYPSEHGNGIFVIAVPLGLAITSPGENKEATWDFVKFVMTRERENLNYMDFLSYKPLFEEHMKKLYDMAQSEEPITQIMVRELPIDVAPATISEIEELKKILESGEAIDPLDYRILDIIDEEAYAYFCSDKTAEQVAENIQNRVKLYLSE